MDDFIYSCPTKIMFGRGTEQGVGQLLKGRRVLFHYGQKSIKSSGLYDSIIRALNAEAIQFLELPGVEPNPKVELVREGITICKEEEIDFILAVGGGSVIDSAKAIAAGTQYPGDVWELFHEQLPISKALPIGVVLTIAAAGSESSPAAVLSSGTSKISINNENLIPRFAILNPELSFSLPAYQTACGISDMMSHVVERYFTNTKNVTVTDELCEGLLRSVIANAKLCLKEPYNYGYRAELMLAGLIAHNGSIGLGREEDWASHKIEHQLSARYGIAHGAGLAIIIPAWMKYVHEHDIVRFAGFARRVWQVHSKSDKETALLGIEAMRSFFREIGLPVSLDDAGIGDESLDIMSRSAVRGESIGNFIKLKPHDVLKIYRIALKG